MSVVNSEAAGAELAVMRPDPETLLLRLAGSWTLRHPLPAVSTVRREVQSGQPRRLTFDTRGLYRWDSGLLTFLLAARDAATECGVEIDWSGLPDGVRSLLRLATAVPERGDRTQQPPPATLERLGLRFLAAKADGLKAIIFVGEMTLSLARFLTGRAQVRRSDLLLLVQQTGAQALPIVALISVLVGLILAFVGSVQLKLFGAQVYVANLVAIGMTREMGAMMTAIIMAGRTGAAFAAQLGTMQVNEEIDALKTLGVDPIDFLVLPRMLALFIMMPLLCVYADVLGMFGGFLVGVGMLDISPAQYWAQTLAWLRFQDFVLGVAKSAVFGVIIAATGCLRGIESGRSAAAVGAAATSAVVTAIVWIIVVDGLAAVLTTVLGI